MKYLSVLFAVLLVFSCCGLNTSTEEIDSLLIDELNIKEQSAAVMSGFQNVGAESEENDTKIRVIQSLCYGKCICLLVSLNFEGEKASYNDEVFSVTQSRIELSSENSSFSSSSSLTSQPDVHSESGERFYVIRNLSKADKIPTEVLTLAFSGLTVCDSDGNPVEEIKDTVTISWENKKNGVYEIFKPSEGGSSFEFLELTPFTFFVKGEEGQLYSKKDISLLFTDKTETGISGIGAGSPFYLDSPVEVDKVEAVIVKGEKFFPE